MGQINHKGIGKHFEMNENENTHIKIYWMKLKQYSGKFIAVNTYIKKKV